MIPGAAEQEVLFAGTFQQELAKPWTTIGGTWQVQQGLLQQVEAGLDDPSKAVLVIGDPEEMSSGIVVTAKLRLDTWKGDDQVRAGVGLCCDPESGHGLNLALNRGQLQFLHDYVQWAPGCEFACQTGVWYWMKLYKTPGILRGKAWRDGEPEPADWMVSWTGFDESLTGYPALLGSSGGPGIEGSSVSFAECRVTRIGPSPTALVREAVHLAGDDAGEPRSPGSGTGRVRARGSAGGPRAPGDSVAATATRLLRQAIAAANGLGAARRHLAARRTVEHRGGPGASAMRAPRGPAWPAKRAGWPRP